MLLPVAGQFVADLPITFFFFCDDDDDVRRRKTGDMMIYSGGVGVRIYKSLLFFQQKRKVFFHRCL